MANWRYQEIDVKRTPMLWDSLAFVVNKKTHIVSYAWAASHTELLYAIDPEATETDEAWDNNILCWIDADHEVKNWGGNPNWVTTNLPDVASHMLSIYEHDIPQQSSSEAKLTGYEQQKESKIITTKQWPLDAYSKVIQVPTTDHSQYQGADFQFTPIPKTAAKLVVMPTVDVLHSGHETPAFLYDRDTETLYLGSEPSTHKQLYESMLDSQLADPAEGFQSMLQGRYVYGWLASWPPVLGPVPQFLGGSNPDNPRGNGAPTPEEEDTIRDLLNQHFQKSAGTQPKTAWNPFKRDEREAPQVYRQPKKEWSPPVVLQTPVVNQLTDHVEIPREGLPWLLWNGQAWVQGVGGDHTQIATFLHNTYGVTMEELSHQKQGRLWPEGVKNYAAIFQPLTSRDKTLLDEAFKPWSPLTYTDELNKTSMALPQVLRVKTPRTKYRGVYGMPFTYFPQFDTITLADSHTYHTKMWPRLPEEYRQAVINSRNELVNGHIVPVHGDYHGGVQFYLDSGQIVDPETTDRIQQALLPYVKQLEFEPEEEEYVDEQKPEDMGQLSLIGSVIDTRPETVPKTWPSFAWYWDGENVYIGENHPRLMIELYGNEYFKRVDENRNEHDLFGWADKIDGQLNVVVMSGSHWWINEQNNEESLNVLSLIREQLNDYLTNAPTGAEVFNIAKVASPLIENPVNYYYVPLTPQEYAGWNDLSEPEKMSYTRRAKGLRRRDNDESSVLRGSDLYAISHRYNGDCAYCGGPDADSYDHVIPLASGGRSTIDNILPCHKQCNHDMNEWDQTLRMKTPPPSAWENYQYQAATSIEQTNWRGSVRWVYVDGQMYIAPTSEGTHAVLFQKIFGGPMTGDESVIAGYAIRTDIRPDHPYIEITWGDNLPWTDDPDLIPPFIIDKLVNGPVQQIGGDKLSYVNKQAMQSESFPMVHRYPQGGIPWIYCAKNDTLYFGQNDGLHTELMSKPGVGENLGHGDTYGRYRDGTISFYYGTPKDLEPIKTTIESTLTKQSTIIQVDDKDEKDTTDIPILYDEPSGKTYIGVSGSHHWPLLRAAGYDAMNIDWYDKVELGVVHQYHDPLNGKIWTEIEWLWDEPPEDVKQELDQWLDQRSQNAISKVAERSIWLTDYEPYTQPTEGNNLPAIKVDGQILVGGIYDEHSDLIRRAAKWLGVEPLAVFNDPKVRLGLYEDGEIGWYKNSMDRDDILPYLSSYFRTATQAVMVERGKDYPNTFIWIYDPEDDTFYIGDSDWTHDRLYGRAHSMAGDKLIDRVNELVFGSVIDGKVTAYHAWDPKKKADEAIFKMKAFINPAKTAGVEFVNIPEDYKEEWAGEQGSIRHNTKPWLRTPDGEFYIGSYGAGHEELLDMIGFEEDYISYEDCTMGGISADPRILGYHLDNAQSLKNGEKVFTFYGDNEDCIELAQLLNNMPNGENHSGINTTSTTWDHPPERRILNALPVILLADGTIIEGDDPSQSHYSLLSQHGVNPVDWGVKYPDGTYKWRYDEPGNSRTSATQIEWVDWIEPDNHALLFGDQEPWIYFKGTFYIGPPGSGHGQIMKAVGINMGEFWFGQDTNTDTNVATGVIIDDEISVLHGSPQYAEELDKLLHKDIVTKTAVKKIARATMYHATHPDRVPLILEKGLLQDMNDMDNHGDDYSWESSPGIYFFESFANAQKIGRIKFGETIVLAVDMSGIPIQLDPDFKVPEDDPYAKYPNVTPDWETRKKWQNDFVDKWKDETGSVRAWRTFTDISPDRIRVASGSVISKTAAGLPKIEEVDHPIKSEYVNIESGRPWYYNSETNTIYVGTEGAFHTDLFRATGFDLKGKRWVNTTGIIAGRLYDDGMVETYYDSDQDPTMQEIVEDELAQTGKKRRLGAGENGSLKPEVMQKCTHYLPHKTLVSPSSSANSLPQIIIYNDLKGHQVLHWVYDAKKNILVVGNYMTFHAEMIQAHLRARRPDDRSYGNLWAGDYWIGSGSIGVLYAPNNSYSNEPPEPVVQGLHAALSQDINAKVRTSATETPHNTLVPLSASVLPPQPTDSYLPILEGSRCITCGNPLSTQEQFYARLQCQDCLDAHVPITNVPAPLERMLRQRRITSDTVSQENIRSILATSPSNSTIGAKGYQTSPPRVPPTNKGKDLFANDSTFNPKLYATDTAYSLRNFSTENFLDPKSPTHEVKDTPNRLIPVTLKQYGPPHPKMGEYIWIELNDGRILLGNGNGYHADLGLTADIEDDEIRNGGYYYINNKAETWEGKDRPDIAEQVKQWENRVTNKLAADTLFDKDKYLQQKPSIPIVVLPIDYSEYGDQYGDEEGLGLDVNRAASGHPAVYFDGTIYIGPLGSHHIDVYRELGLNGDEDEWDRTSAWNIWPETSTWKVVKYDHETPEDKPIRKALEDWARKNYWNTEHSANVSATTVEQVPLGKNVFSFGRIPWVYDWVNDKLWLGSDGGLHQDIFEKMEQMEEHPNVQDASDLFQFKNLSAGMIDPDEQYDQGVVSTFIGKKPGPEVMRILLAEAEHQEYFDTNKEGASKTGDNTPWYVVHIPIPPHRTHNEGRPFIAFTDGTIFLGDDTGFHSELWSQMPEKYKNYSYEYQAGLWLDGGIEWYSNWNQNSINRKGVEKALEHADAEHSETLRRESAMRMLIHGITVEYTPGKNDINMAPFSVPRNPFFYDKESNVVYMGGAWEYHSQLMNTLGLNETSKYSLDFDKWAAGCLDPTGEWGEPVHWFSDAYFPEVDQALLAWMKENPELVSDVSEESEESPKTQHDEVTGQYSKETTKVSIEEVNEPPDIDVENFENRRPMFGDPFVVVDGKMYWGYSHPQIMEEFNLDYKNTPFTAGWVKPNDHEIWITSFELPNLHPGISQETADYLHEKYPGWQIEDWGTGKIYYKSERESVDEGLFERATQAAQKVADEEWNCNLVESHMKESDVAWKDFANRESLGAKDFPNFRAMIYDSTEDKLILNSDLDCAPYHPIMISKMPGLWERAKEGLLYFGSAAVRQNLWMWYWDSVEEIQGTTDFFARADELAAERLGSLPIDKESHIAAIQEMNNPRAYEETEKPTEGDPFVVQDEKLYWGLRHPLIFEEFDLDVDRPFVAGWVEHYGREKGSIELWSAEMVAHPDDQYRVNPNLYQDKKMVRETLDFLHSMYPNYQIDDYGRLKEATQIENVKATEPLISSDRVPLVYSPSTDTLYVGQPGGLHTDLFAAATGQAGHAVQMPQFNENIYKTYSAGIYKPPYVDKLFGGEADSPSYIDWFYGPLAGDRAPDAFLIDKVNRPQLADDLQEIMRDKYGTTLPEVIQLTRDDMEGMGTPWEQGEPFFWFPDMNRIYLAPEGYLHSALASYLQYRGGEDIQGQEFLAGAINLPSNYAGNENGIWFGTGLWGRGADEDGWTEKQKTTIITALRPYLHDQEHLGAAEPQVEWVGEPSNSAIFVWDHERNIIIFANAMQYHHFPLIEQMMPELKTMPQSRKQLLWMEGLAKRFTLGELDYVGGVPEISDRAGFPWSNEASEKRVQEFYLQSLGEDVRTAALSPEQIALNLMDEGEYVPFAYQNGKIVWGVDTRTGETFTHPHMIYQGLVDANTPTAWGWAGDEEVYFASFEEEVDASIVPAAIRAIKKQLPSWPVMMARTAAKLEWVDVEPDDHKDVKQEGVAP